MVKNLLIARKTYRFLKTAGIIFFFKCERPVSSGSYQAVNARKFKRGNEMEKSSGKEKGLGKIHKEGVVVEMNRWSETDHIQSQQTVPLFTEGRLKGSNVKGLQHL